MHRPGVGAGQQQRVAVARALVGRPSPILADEPNDNPDQENGDRLIDLLDDLYGTAATPITVTHNAKYADRAKRRLQMLDCRLIDGRAGAA